MIEQQTDILIVGGGLTGACLMLALAQAGLNLLMIDTKPISVRATASFDARSLALSPASRQILQRLNVWPLLEHSAAAINTIHVTEQHQFGSTQLQRSTNNNPLGHVIEMHHIDAALHQLLEKRNILAPAQIKALDPEAGTVVIDGPDGERLIKARLIVAADGTHSTVRQLCGVQAHLKFYDQHAIVANIGLARAHQYCAHERFTKAGPLALLPLTGLRSSLVWAMHPSDAERLHVVSDDVFLQHLQRAFGYRLGRFTRVGQRVIYPLQQVIMPEQVIGNVVFVGNAAHTLHPVAGQGFNLGLRDVAMLAQRIMNDGFGINMLNHYQRDRQHDQQAIVRLTNGLIELFTSALPGLGLMRSAGMITVDNIPLLKKLLSKYARGYSGIIPDLVCGIPLHSQDL